MTTPPPFIVYALPESRSLWLSQFLSHGGWSCGHDTAPRLRGLEDIRATLNTPYTGTVETAAAPWWRLAHFMRPDLRTVVIRRPVEDCLRSMMAIKGATFGGVQLRRDLIRMDAKLDQIARRVPGVLSVSFDDLATEEGCARVYEHCLGLPHDPAHWRAMAGENLTVNVPAQLRYLTAHAVQIERLKHAATQRIIRDMVRRSPIISDAATFQEEPFAVFLRDSRALRAEAPTPMNEALLQRMADRGYLVVTTARSNGRLAGYVATVVVPSLETPDRPEAMNVVSYVDPAFSALGLKLQRASIAAAESRGAFALYSRQGVHGSAKDHTALFRRLGAVPDATSFSLDLGN